MWGQPEKLDRRAWKHGKESAHVLLVISLDSIMITLTIALGRRTNLETWIKKIKCFQLRWKKYISVAKVFEMVIATLISLRNASPNGMQDVQASWNENHKRKIVCKILFFSSLLPLGSLIEIVFFFRHQELSFKLVTKRCVNIKEQRACLDK